MFFGALGFTAESWSDLAEALCEQHLVLEPSAEASTSFGRKYELRGTLGGPSGRAEVVSVWIIRTGEDRPRFVTAYPGAKS